MNQVSQITQKFGLAMIFRQRNHENFNNHFESAFEIYTLQ